MAVIENLAWRECFLDRENEIMQIIKCFDYVVEGNGPKMCAILGERGMGKSRLVQQAYCEIREKYDESGYWPDGLNAVIRQALVGPEIDQINFPFNLAEKYPNYLWWGLRVTDPIYNHFEARNINSSTLSHHITSLDPHLIRHRLLSRLNLLKSKYIPITKEGLSALSDDFKEKFVLSTIGADALNIIFEISVDTVIGAAKTLGKLGIDWLKNKEEIEEVFGRAQKVSAIAEKIEVKNTIIDNTISNISNLFDERISTNVTPLIIFVDDAHGARDGGDDGTLRFLSDLWTKSIVNNWPILFIATHWKSQWDEDMMKSKFLETFAKTFSEIKNYAPDKFETIELSNNANFSKMIDLVIPELGELARQKIMARSDGNPGYLAEILIKISVNMGWLGPDNEFTAWGIKEFESEKFHITSLIESRLDNPNQTHPDVRKSIILASVEGMEFQSEVIGEAGKLLGLNNVEANLEVAEKPGYFVGGVKTSKAAFLQRAIHEVASKKVAGSLGDPEKVYDAIRQAAKRLGQEAREDTFDKFKFTAIEIGFETLSIKPESRLSAARGLLGLIRLTRKGANGGIDYAAGYKYANEFEIGIEIGKWQITDFSKEEIELVFNAIFDHKGGARAINAAKLHIQLCDREVEIYENQYFAKANLLRARQLLWNCYYYDKKFSEAIEIAEGNVKIGRELLSAEKSVNSYLQLVTALRNLSISNFHFGMIIPAIEHDIEAIDIIKTGLEIHNNQSLVTLMLNCQIGLFCDYLQIDNIASAEIILREAQETLIQLEKFGDDAAFLEAKMDFNSRVAEINRKYNSAGVLDEVTSRFQNAKSLYEVNPSFVNRENLARLYHSFIYEKSQRGKIMECLSILEEGLEFVRLYHQEVDSPYSAQLYSLILEVSAIFHFHNKNKKIAEEEYRFILALKRRYLNDTQLPDARRDLAIILDFIHTNFLGKEYAAYREESFRIRKDLFEKFKTEEYTREYLSALIGLVDSSIRAKNEVLAISAAQEADRVSFNILKIRSCENLMTRSLVLERLGDINNSKGNFNDALRFYEDTIKLKKEMIERFDYELAREHLTLMTNKKNNLTNNVEKRVNIFEGYKTNTKFEITNHESGKKLTIKLPKI